MSICVIHDTDPNIILSANEYQDKTCGEIIQKLNFQDSILLYRNEFYIEPLHDNDKPLELHNDLVLDTKIENYPPPPVYLRTGPTSESNTFSIAVIVKTQLKDELPPMLVGIDMRELNNLTMEDLLLSCRAAFGYDFSDEKFTLNGNELSLSDPASPVIQECKKSHLELSITVCDQGKKKISARGHVTAEIISSEESYNNDLQVIEDYWEPKFCACKAFEEKETHSLFRDIKQIHNVHKDLLAELKQIKPGFSAEMSYVYLRHLNNFTKATAFVSAFKSLDDMMKRKRSTRSVDKQITEIEQNLPLQNGRNFMSYYITPVQRYPRYPLLFRELDKCTPNFHPEKHYISYTFTKLNEVNKQIDSISHRVLQIQLMNSIQQQMPDDYLVIDHGREIIEQVNVRVVCKKSGPGIIYLFNNLVLLVSAKKKIFIDINPIKFWFANGKPGINSIYTVFNNETYQLDFADLAEKTVFIEAYHNLMHEEFKKIKTEKPFIKWLDVEINEAISERVSHEGCVSTGSAYFFGGTNESTVPTNTLIKYNLADQSWSIEGNTPVPPRESHTMVALRGDLYICFGCNSKNKKVYNDIWVYNIASKKWSEIKVNAKPRYGHSCIVYDSKLYFFGGRIADKIDSKNIQNTSNVCMFDPHTQEFHDYGELPNSPDPRFGHCAALVGKKHNKMVIIGGRADGLFNDVWVLSFKKMCWAKMFKCNVSRRADLKCSLVSERYLFVSGGVTGSKDPEIVVIDTNSWTTFDVEQYGNIPPRLSKHSMVAIDQHKVMIFGGTDRMNHRSFPSAWIFDTTDSMHNFALASPTTVQKYWDFTNVAPANPQQSPQQEQPTTPQEQPQPEQQVNPLPPRTHTQISNPPKLQPIEEKPPEKKPIQVMPSYIPPATVPPPISLPPSVSKQTHNIPVIQPRPPVERRKPERMQSVVTQRQDKPQVGFMSEDLKSIRDRLRNSQTREVPKKEVVVRVQSFKATGVKFNMAAVSSQLCIDVTQLNPFEQKSATLKCQRLWQMSTDNNKKEALVSKMEAMISGNFDPPAGTQFLLKIFDDNSRCSKLTKLVSDTPISEVIKKATSILGRSDAILSIAVGNGDQRPLDVETFRLALRCVYKGEMRCLTINAL